MRQNQHFVLTTREAIGQSWFCECRKAGFQERSFEAHGSGARGGRSTWQSGGARLGRKPVAGSNPARSTEADLRDQPGKDGTWPLAVINGRPSSPCVGSGLCCRKALCEVGLEKHGSRPGPCPSLVEKDGRKLVRRDPERVGDRGGAPSCALVRRGRVLHASVQQRQGGDPTPVRLDLLVAFTKHLIRNTVSECAIWLSIYAAAEETGVTRQEAELMVKSVMAEHAQRNFPEGF